MNTTPPFGVAMVTRDRCDKLHRTLEDRLHDKIVECRNNIAANQRRLVSVCGEDGKNGKVGAMQKRQDDQERELKAQRAELWKIKLAAAAAAGVGSGGMHLILKLLN